MGPLLGGRPILRYGTATAVIVVHGNSLVNGQSGATSSFPAQLQAQEPFLTGATCYNRGTDGLRTYQMTSEYGSRIDPLFNAAKDNILVVWEGRNSIYNGGRTPAQAWDEIVAYCAQALAARPTWKIVLMTCLPHRLTEYNDAQCDAANDLVDEFNTLMLANWRASGAVACVDVVQPGSPFRALRTLTDFTAIQHLWSPTESFWVHLSNEGYGVIAGYVASVLKRLPVR